MCGFGVLLSAAAVASVIVAATVVIASVIFVASATQTVDLTIGRTIHRAEAAAALRFCGRGEHIQRELDVFEVAAGVTGNSSIGTGFRHTSAHGIDYHIDGTEQFYNGKQTDGYINSNGRTHGCISIGNSDGIAFAAVMMMAVAGIATVAGATIGIP